MRFFCLALMITCSAAAAPAAIERVIHVEKDIDFIVPAGSPVRFESLGKYDTVTYAGQFLLTGRYTYGFVPDNPDEDIHNQLELSFTIPERNAKKLPYWSRDRPIREIYIRNPGRFVQQVIDHNDLARLHARRIQQISGVATIEVRRLRTSIECDYQSTSVEFVSARNQQDRKVATLMVDEPGC